MYTFQPLVDTTLTHTGLYWWLAAMVVVFIILVRISLHEDGFGPLGFSLFVGVFALWTWTIYDNSYNDVRPLNAQYTATFVKYQPEGHSETRQSGKTTQHVDVHEIYVVYRIDDTGNDVILRAKSGVEYPKHIVLYKN